MWKQILKSLSKMLLNWGFNLLFNAIDKNKDGTLSKSELKEFSKFIETKLKNLKK
jgi:Ca2+-binding EF-hand superfamily protein